MEIFFITIKIETYLKIPWSISGHKKIFQVSFLKDFKFWGGGRNCKYQGDVVLIAVNSIDHMQ